MTTRDEQDTNERPSLAGRRAVDEMIELQRRIFERQRKIIESNEARSPAFSRYRNEYRRAVSGYIEESGFGALCDAIAASRVAFVADYHTLALAQRTFVKIIQGAMHQVDNICLALEFVAAEHQEHLDRFISGEIKERTFLQRIRYKDQWPYDIWPNFRPIFEFAQENGFPVLAIDSDGALPLGQRDKRAAAVIAQAVDEYPDATILVYTGQMHIAPSHLPAAVDKAFIKRGMESPERVIIYQNAEEIYWQLSSIRREGVEVVQVDAESYCVNNTPPLVQQLSYLHWVRFDNDLLEYAELEDTVREILRNLGEFLDIPYREAARSVRVLLPGDLDLLATLEDEGLPDSEAEAILAHVEAGESACLCSLSAIYLATLSINHAAEEAAHYLKQVVAPAETPASLRDEFYFRVLNEACGFFGSKVINPKRKTDHPGKLRRTFAAARRHGGEPTPEESATGFALEHLTWERGGRDALDGSLLDTPAAFHAAAHILGYILGDRLYYALTTGEVRKAAIRRLFLNPLDAENEAIELYLELAEQVRRVKIPHRI